MENEWTLISKKPKKEMDKSTPPPYTSQSCTSQPYTSQPYTSPQPYAPRRNYSSPLPGKNAGFRGGGRGGHGGYVPKHKKNNVPIPDFASPEEEAKFKKLQCEIPHIMMPGQIRRIQQEINIDDLAVKILSDEYIEKQRQGWKYERVIKPDDPVDDIPMGSEYDIQELGNKWGDLILFKLLLK